MDRKMKAILAMLVVCASMLALGCTGQTNPSPTPVTNGSAANNVNIPPHMPGNASHRTGFNGTRPGGFNGSYNGSNGPMRRFNGTFNGTYDGMYNGTYNGSMRMRPNSTFVDNPNMPVPTYTP